MPWYGHVTQMSHKRTANQEIDALPRAKGLERNPDFAGGIMLKTWSRFGILPAKLSPVAGDRDAWRSQLELLPPQPQKDKRAKGNTLN